MTPPKAVRQRAAREWLSTEQLAEEFGIPAETWKRWRRTGDGPTPHRFGRHIRYHRRDVTAWVQEHRVTAA
jgi:predicted DNA-binding transcriptional regulator AlpA